jgi:similar to stage IV sporulation protein
MIRVEGLSLEKFLNMASREGIRVFGITRVSYTVLRAGVSAAGYRRLSKIASEQYTVIREKSFGLPFGIGWLIKRKALLIGLFVVAAAIFTASLFVWEIRITGIEYHKAARLLTELDTLGLRPGMLKSSIDLKELEMRLIIDHDEFAWIDIGFKGVVANIEIIPAEPVPEIVDDKTPCNIVAKKDAYIENVTVKAGRASVKAGDTVRAGDMLISGVVWDEGAPRMLFAARGEVIGNVWYTSVASVSMFNETHQKTGRTEIERVIYIGGDSASVEGPCTFDVYDTQIKEEYYIGGGLFLPVKVAVLEHSEATVTKTPKPFDTLMVYLEERAYYDAQAKVPQDARIVGHSTVFKVMDDIMTATVYLKTQEDIGKAVYLEDEI